MGRGLLKNKNKLKKQYLSQAVKYIEQLEKENQTLKSDPNSVIGQFIEQFRELHGQNSRLSVLSACLLKKLGESVTLTKEEMEAFKDNRINIKWELPEGVEKHEDAASYIFSYELLPIEQQGPGVTIQPTEIPGEEQIDTAVAATLDHVAAVATGEEQPVEDVMTEEALVNAVDL